MADYNVTVLYTTKQEIQDSAVKVGGDGTIYEAHMLSSGAGVELHVWSPNGAHTQHLIHPPANCGVSGASLGLTGTAIIVSLTGHNVTQEKPRDNYVGQVQIPLNVVHNAAELGDAAGAFTGTVPTPPPPTPAPVDTAAIAQAVVLAWNADPIVGKTIKNAARLAVQAEVAENGLLSKSNFSDVFYQANGVYQRLKDTVYEVVNDLLKSAGVVK